MNLCGMLSEAEVAGLGGEKELCGLLMPHLQRAVALHRRLSAAYSSGQAALASLNLLPTAVWLLGSSGELLHANPAAERLIRRGDVLTLGADGRLHARVNSENQRLLRLITSALRTGLGHGTEAGGTQRMWGNRAGGMLYAVVMPLCYGLSGFGAAAAALFVTDPNCLPQDLEGNLRRLYALTPAEARLTAALIAGGTVQDFAGRTGISEATARTHLKSIFAKTDTRRQSDLIRVMVTGPAMLARIGA